MAVDATENHGTVIFWEIDRFAFYEGVVRPEHDLDLVPGSAGQCSMYCTPRSSAPSTTL